ncbi:SgcJ/EcaC family oxidoreductase [Alteribacillus sp. HJP-4]|uniref:SgcJ/EcaC family oxidoreductase n=1 Tax=Alteribacillus sp. HJP-4 TaxID=2775394 RepID=UPI0035CD2A15
MSQSLESEIQELYEELINGWNKRNAFGMAALYSEDGMQIGFDGSKLAGRKEILSHLELIFAEHPTPPYVTKVKSLRSLGEDAAVLHAIAGMVPPGETSINPELNTHHTLIAVRNEGVWKIVLFQNTPAQFHGRPELAAQMTEELKMEILT